MPEAETAPTAEQRSEPPKSDAALSAPAVGTPEPRAEQKPPRRPTLVPSVIVGLVVAAVAGLSIWYLVRPQPLLVQGEVDATRFDLAARVDGRVAEIPVERGQNIDASAVLVKIDNPETLAKNEQALAAKIVAEAQFANVGVPLVTLIDLDDMWIHFDLREDLVKTLKVGDRFDVRIPALADRRITIEVKLIATKGEYASWRATRATGDFDLRTFSIRAYPVQPVPELRPGMSAYLDWRSRQ